jgi:hypothetical protein
MPWGPVHILNICISLAMMKKGNNYITEYIGKVCTLADEMTLGGKKDRR